jgi:hypothetical protein
MKGEKLLPAATRRSQRDEHRTKSHCVDCTPLQGTWLFPKITIRSAIAITWVTGPILANSVGNPPDLNGCYQREMKDVPKRAGISWHGWHGFRRGLALNLNRLAYL